MPEMNAWGEAAANQFRVRVSVLCLFKILTNLNPSLKWKSPGIYTLAGVNLVYELISISSKCEYKIPPNCNALVCSRFFRLDWNVDRPMFHFVIHSPMIY